MDDAVRGGPAAWQHVIAARSPGDAFARTRRTGRLCADPRSRMEQRKTIEELSTEIAAKGAAQNAAGQIDTAVDRLSICSWAESSASPRKPLRTGAPRLRWRTISQRLPRVDRLKRFEADGGTKDQPRQLGHFKLVSQTLKYLFPWYLKCALAVFGESSSFTICRPLRHSRPDDLSAFVAQDQLDHATKFDFS
ncbi:hypothetical protein AB7008_20445 [Bradyrhizobium sp. 521_C7_N1_3]|uniref:hypothetical protein n=1 Tax=Bradyrhizobium sp. 521_C7_N1_3 TaxID=3240368 RepID=UPI003F8BED92